MLAPGSPLTTDEFTLVPADYFGTDRTTVRDAVSAFADDLLAPLLADLDQPARSPSNILKILASNDLPAARAFLACICRALIGPRGPKAFHEAARVWHRRAAAVAALRNEKPDRPSRLAAIGPSLDIALRPLPDRAADHRQSIGRGR